MKQLFLVLLIGSMVSSCSKPYFITPDFDGKTVNHKKVAVLPFKMIYTGKLPKGITEEQVLQIEEAESIAFQQSLYNQLLRQSGTGKKDIKIEFLDIRRGNKMLETQEISIRESWELSVEELCEILGVDAVVRTKVTKQHLMSDLESMGIQIAEDLLRIFAPEVWTFTPSVNSSTDNIKADCSVLARERATVLWQMSVNYAADWNNPHEQIIERTNNRFSRYFPYRPENK